MKIEIPDRFLGKPIKGAMDKILKEVPKREKSKNASPIVAPSSSNLTDADKYILLPSMQHGNYSYPDTLVSMEKNHFNKDWNKTHEVLKKEGAYMLTIRQFADFLNLLRSGSAYDGNGQQVDQKKLNSILDEIYTIRSPRRAEWLDAKFVVRNKTLGVFSGKTQINYDHRLVNGQLVAQRSEELEECLMDNKQIDISDWLSNANYQGLPSKNVSNGSLYYYAPVNGKVVRFDAVSDGANLYCGRYPAGANSSLGVRVTRVKI